MPKIIKKPSIDRMSKKSCKQKFFTHLLTVILIAIPGKIEWQLIIDIDVQLDSTTPMINFDINPENI